MMHDDLLDIAVSLAQMDVDRPREASLRRAVSTAYYALFHALARMCADTLIGDEASQPTYSLIYRSLDHGRSKDIFRKFGGSGDDNTAALAKIFILMQERRHTADYDPATFPYGRAETIDLIEQVRTALQLIAALPQDEKLLLSAGLIARPR